MKKIIYLILCISVNSLFAQKVMSTKTGIIHFEASVPLFEEVAATNKTVSYDLNTKDGAFYVVVLMKDFGFKLSLMEEHFNTKYLETDDFPQATFKGKIEGFNINIIGDSPKEFKLNGELKIHGKTKKIITTITLKKAANTLEMVSDFKVNVKDFNIKIPEMLSMKVAETVNIKTEFVVQ